MIALVRAAPTKIGRRWHPPTTYLASFAAMPEPIEHAENRGMIESILMWIPGFRGYLRKENRREADELERNWLADRLNRGKRGLNELARRLTDKQQLDALGEIERLRTNLDKVIARIRGAMQGYSGFFDLVDIDETVLERIYRFDASLMERVADVADRLEALGKQAEQAAGEVLAEVRRKIDEIDDAWDEREDILSGIE